MMQEMWLVLKEDATEWDVRQASVMERWLWRDSKPQTDEQPRRVVFATADEKNAIHYIEDAVIGLQYLLIEGEDIDSHLTVLQRVACSYLPSEVLERAEAASTPAEYFRRVREVAIAAPKQFDQRFFDVVCKALAHPEPEIRRTALLAFGYIGWKEFEPILEKMRQSDPDPDVREVAGIALDAARSSGWRGKS